MRRLEDKQWVGDADFICKTSRSSKLGDYSYRIVDTKLSKTPKASRDADNNIFNYNFKAHRRKSLQKQAS